MERQLHVPGEGGSRFVDGHCDACGRVMRCKRIGKVTILRALKKKAGREDPAM